MTPSEKANREFWAARRAGQPKAAAKMSVADFIIAANRQLNTLGPLPGTRFIVIEQRTLNTATAVPSWEGPETMRPLVQRIVQEITTNFRLPVPFQIDRC